MGKVKKQNGAASLNWPLVLYLLLYVNWPLVLYLLTYIYWPLVARYLVLLREGKEAAI